MILEIHAENRICERVCNFEHADRIHGHVMRRMLLIIVLIAAASLLAIQGSDGTDAGTGTEECIDWSVDGNTLTLNHNTSGTDMKNYSESSRPGWETDEGWGNVTIVNFGEGITSIGKFAFFKCGNITTLNTPSSLQRIDYCAFQFCSSLSAINLPKGLQSIGDYAFGSCHQITTLVVPDSVTDVGYRKTFQDCTGLTDLTIPINLNLVGREEDKEYKFVGTENIKKITFTPGTSYEGHPAGVGYDYENGSGDKGREKTPWYFSRNSLETIVFQDKITVIGEDNAYGVTQLKNVTIGNDVTIIHECAFESCTSLQNIVLPQNLQEIWNYSFKNCSQLTSIAIPNKVTTIGGTQTFNGCSALASLTIPIDVGTVSDDIFSGCSNIREITFTSGTTGKGCNYNWNDREKTPWYISRDALETITFQNGIKEIGALNAYYAWRVTNITLPEGVTKIGEFAFQWCTSLQTVNLSAGLEKIGSCAFQFCSALSAINLPKGLQSIGDYAFGSCQQITTLVVPDSVTDVGYRKTFQDCTGLTDLTIPINLNLVGREEDKEYKFVGTENIKKITFTPGTDYKDHPAGVGYDYENGTGDKGREKTPWYFSRDVLETIIFSDDITQIGKNNAYHVNQLKNVTIGKDVKVIRPSAFESCTSLQSIELPSNLQTIGDYAFASCSSLTQMNIPNTVTSVGNTKTFYGCSAMTSLTIPINVGTVDKEIFAGCTNIGTLTFTPGVGDTAGVGVDYNDGDRPQTPWYVSRDALGTVIFQNSDSANITAIGKSGLYGAQKVTSITIPDTVTKIGKSAFEECRSLSDFDFPQSLSRLDDYAFKNCVSLPSADISSVTNGNFGIEVFYGCFSLYSLTLPISLNTLGASTDGRDWSAAFQYCFGLRNVSFVKDSIGSGVGCEYSDTTYKYTPWYGSNAVYSITFSDDITSIGAYTFYECSRISSDLTLPVNLNSVGQHAFDGCSGLTGNLNIPSAVKSLGAYAFKGCSGLTGTLTIPGSLEAQSVQEHLFDGCSGLTGTLTIPSSISVIEAGAFKGCSGLTGTLTIPGTITAVYESAFEGCSGFTKLRIAANLGTISDSTFRTCTGLTGTLTIPDSVAVIGTYAFGECSGFTGALNLSDAVNSIGEGAFSHCTGLTSVKLPSGLQTLPDVVFEDCYGIVTVSSNLTVIGAWAFADCHKLTTFSYNKGGLVSIQDHAFYGCSNMTSQIVIPDTVTKIDYYAFAQCNNLLSVEVGSGCKDIHKRAFPTHIFYTGPDLKDTVNTDSNDFKGYLYSGVDTGKMIRYPLGTQYHTITYDVNGGSADAPVQGDLATGVEFTVASYSGSITGYSFGGWEYRGNIYEPGYTQQTPSEDVVFKAYWTTAKHSVTYYTEGGTAPAPVQADVAEGDTFTVKGYQGTKEGCVFVGWLYNNTLYQQGGEITMGRYNISLKACWTEPHNVTYNVGGGSEKAPTQDPVREGLSFTVQDYQGTKDGYQFKGWAYKGVLYQQGDNITMGKEDIVLSAKWVREHSVTYDLNGGEGDTPVQDPVAEGYTFAAQACTATHGTLSFVGWLYDNTLYQQGDEITMGQYDIVLKADWQKVLAFHNVTYDVAGGSGDAPTQEPVREGDSFNIKWYYGTKQGLEFAGWSYNGKTYVEGSNIKMGDKDMVLTAVWVTPKEYQSMAAFLVLIGAIVGIGAVQGIAYYMKRRGFR